MLAVILRFKVKAGVGVRVWVEGMARGREVTGFVVRKFWDE